MFQLAGSKVNRDEFMGYGSQVFMEGLCEEETSKQT